MQISAHQTALCAKLDVERVVGYDDGTHTQTPWGIPALTLKMPFI